MSDRLTEIRCKHCRRLLCKVTGDRVVVQIFCPRCKKLMTFSLTVETVAAPVAQLAG